MKKADVSTPSPRVEYLEAERQLVRTIMGGTFAMREAVTKYLPRHPAESSGVYKTRLEKTFLDNFVDLAITKSTGKIFAKPIKTENIPSQIDGLLTNIDRQGRALDPFIMDVAKQAFEDGISFVMADMPPSDGITTLADEKAAGVRPYAIHIKPQDILETVSEMIGGVETLTRVRIREVIQELDGWDYVTIDQIRVWYRDTVVEDNGAARMVVRWELYRQSGAKKEWELYDQGATTFKSIYLVPFYTNRTGFMEGLPPFQNIAESTLEHWQWKSEHAHALSMQCFGMLTAVGVSEESEIQVGPAKVLRATDPNAKFAYTETTGVGVTMAAETLKAIESRIETAGVNLRVENAGQVTATAAAIDSEDTTAGLKAVAIGFSNSINQLLQYFAEMMGIDPGNASAECNTDFGAAKGTQAGLTELSKARALGDISRNQYLDTLIWRGEIKPDFDKELNQEELDAEGPALSVAGDTSAGV